MIVEVWSDVVCPWCYIGKRRFEAALASFHEANPDAEVDVRYRAFMLDPSAPFARSQPVREVYEKKFGGAAAAADMMERVTEAAAGEGLDFRLDIAKRSNTLAAHRLLVLAEQQGVQRALKERLLAAYFTEGRAIGIVDDLVDTAVEVGLSADEARRWLDGDGGNAEVKEQLEFAAHQGFSGVPTYVFDRKAAVSGAQEPAVFLEMLERALSEATAA